jgi:hypothetical protein
MLSIMTWLLLLLASGILGGVSLSAIKLTIYCSTRDCIMWLLRCLTEGLSALLNDVLHVGTGLMVKRLAAWQILNCSQDRGASEHRVNNKESW